MESGKPLEIYMIDGCRVPKKKEMSWLIGGDDYSAYLGNVQKE